MKTEDPTAPMEAEPLADEPRRHPLLFALAFLCLFFSVPFYYPEGRQPVVVLGLPDWCWVTLAADILFAAVTVYLILRTWCSTAEPGEGQ